METVLDFYDRPCPAGTLRLAFDERPCQLLADKVDPLPRSRGVTKKVDHEYQRCGVSNVLLAYDLDSGQRYVEARDQRTKKDFAQFWAKLALETLPSYNRIEVVLDNLNTHNHGSFYEHLPLDQATALRRKISFVYTPKHGSWLNMAEIEFSALARQCLGKRRIASTQELSYQVSQWAQQRNQAAVKISWTFTSEQAQMKFKRHYDKVLGNV